MRRRDHKIFARAKKRRRTSHIGYLRDRRWPRMRIVSSLVMFALLLFSPSAGSGAIAPIVVERGAGAERCPEAEPIMTRVEQIRGRPADGLPAPYRVSFARKDDGFVATIRSDAAGGVRTLEHTGAQCAALGDAVAVTLALLFDSDVAATRVEPPPPPAASPAPSPPRPATLDAPLARQLTFSLGGGALFGVLRPVSPAFLAELGARWGPARVSAGAMFAWPSDVSLGPGKVEQRAEGALARLCWAPWERGSLRVDTCSGVATGRVVGEAEGFTRNERHTRLWLAIPIEAAFANLASPVGWEMAIAGLVPIERPDFSIDGLGVAYASPPIGAMLSLRALGVLPF
jgi:hypothetical protein